MKCPVDSIGIIGGGTVGQALARCYAEHCTVRIFDLNPCKGTHKNLREIYDCQLVFLCLPTPQIQGSRKCNLGAIYEHCSYLQNSDQSIVLKSTVPIGTTEFLSTKFKLPNIVHSPEFLTARCAVLNAQTPALNVIGRPATSPQYACEDLLADLYAYRYPGTETHLMTSSESEAVKLFLNGFFATKVSYFNEIHTLCEKLKLNWGMVHEAMLADGRCGSTHTNVPGPDGMYGFGGACLPKDLNSLISCFHEAQVTTTILHAVSERNSCLDRARSAGPDSPVDVNDSVYTQLGAVAI